MADDDPGLIQSAFNRIERAIRNLDDQPDLDKALDDIFTAVNVIAPGLPQNLESLSTDEIGNVLARFSLRAENATEDQAGNTPEQTFLALAVTAEIRRRARLDGIPVLEWCRRERIRGFVTD